MVNPELLRYRADGGGQAAVLERPAESLAEEDDSLKHWPGVVGCVYADAGAACGQVEVGDAFVHLEEFSPLSLVVGRFIEVCLEQATMIVQFDARHIWGCRVSPSTRGIFAGGVGRRVPIPGP